MATRKNKLKSRGKKAVAAVRKKVVGAAALPKVRVRMYRQGLGDCFLVTFNPGGAEAHMLIDCGTLGSKGGARMEDVIADIKAVTKGRLNLLVVTHEHKDHVSGFGDYEKEFKEITVGQVWMAWTENPLDDLAQKLERHRGDLAMTAMAAATALKAANEKGMAAEIEDLLGFSALGADKFARTIDEAMDFVRTGFGRESRYLEPGETVEESWLPGFRFYILGPPRSLDAIKDTGEHHSEDLYGVAPGLKLGAMKAAGLTTGVSEDEGEMPFDIRFRMAEEDPLLARSLQSYRDSANGWRRVDSDWLHGAADLALQLDSVTNNTSLAFAIERVADGKVLLFPADAQQGHWLSWHGEKMKWKQGSGKDAPEIKATDLLKRTVFYKVGHHGSHNATAKGKGLELMARKEELVAFVPVDREIALNRSPKGSWKMPARDLYLRLLESCDGRVVRSDLGWADDAAEARNKVVEEEFLEMAAKSSWASWKLQQGKANVKISPLSVDYVLS